MKKILFIYGFGGSPGSKFCTLIRQALPTDEYEVLCPVYPQEDCAKAHEFLLSYVKENDIDLIIGTSLGGFIALTLNTNVSTIVLNPCMVPSAELPLLKPRADHPDDVVPSAEMIETYKPFEPDAFNKEAIHRRWVMGLFAENDELLGTKYKERFTDCYDRVRTMPGGHHGNAEAIPTIVEAIRFTFAPAYNVDSWFDFMCKLKQMNPIEFKKSSNEEFFWLWKELQFCTSGDVVIRVVEGGNRVLKVGDSRCGYTPGLVLGAPIVIQYPSGDVYQGGTIESIDWENTTFKTAQSTYSFHFVRK